VSQRDKKTLSSPPDGLGGLATQESPALPSQRGRAARRVKGSQVPGFARP